MNAPPTTGLVLTGGGARAAYQVGVLKAVMQIRRESNAPPGNPFPVITGTSAGALSSSERGRARRQRAISQPSENSVSQRAPVWISPSEAAR